ncbi:MAG: hypothetical protein IT372_27835 [Polyangiaceae bacterium]|nr:hypothetical protein [Polyangiaceae bacterium]
MATTKHPLPLAAALAAATWGCIDIGDLNEDFSVPTAIVVDPIAFLGDVQCSDAPGAMRSYVATITDRTDPGALFTLPSSPPVPCSQPVQFRYVVPDHVYTAEIDGYEQRVQDLVPLNGPGSGSRHIQDQTGAPVSPRWTTFCTDAAARDGVSTLAGACDPLQDRGTPGATAIRLDPTAALGDLRCAAEGGQIAAFDILPESGGLPPVVGVACPPVAPVLYDAGLSAGITYSFRVEATGLDGTVYGAACSALAADGITATATCDPLSASGALTIPVGAALQAAGLVCAPGSAATYVATLQVAGPALQSPPLPCSERAHFTPLAPGSYEASVEIRGDDGAPLATVTCAGDVSAGTSVVATCAASP